MKEKIANATSIYALSAPSTMLRMVPLPRCAGEDQTYEPGRSFFTSSSLGR